MEIMQVSEHQKVAFTLYMEKNLRSPVEVGSWNPIVYKGFIHPRWLFGISSLNSHSSSLFQNACLTPQKSPSTYSFIPASPPKKKKNST